MKWFTFHSTFILFISLYLTVSPSLADTSVTDSDTFISTPAHTADYSSKKLVRLKPRSNDEVAIIADKLPQFTNDSIDFWTEPSSSLQPVDLMIDVSLLPLIKRFTSLYNLSNANVVIDNVQR